MVCVRNIILKLVYFLFSLYDTHKPFNLLGKNNVRVQFPWDRIQASLTMYLNYRYIRTLPHKNISIQTGANLQNTHEW